MPPRYDGEWKRWPKCKHIEILAFFSLALRFISSTGKFRIHCDYLSLVVLACRHITSRCQTGMLFLCAVHIIRMNMTHSIRSNSIFLRKTRASRLVYRVIKFGKWTHHYLFLLQAIHRRHRQKPKIRLLCFLNRKSVCVCQRIVETISRGHFRLHNNICNFSMTFVYRRASASLASWFEQDQGNTNRRTNLARNIWIISC